MILCHNCESVRNVLTCESCALKIFILKNLQM